MPNSEPITLERLNAKGQHAAALVEQFHAAGKHAVAALNDFAADLLEVLPKHDTPVKHDTPEYPVAIWHPLIEQAELLAQTIARDEDAAHPLDLDFVNKEAQDFRVLLMSAVEDAKTRAAADAS